MRLTFTVEEDRDLTPQQIEWVFNARLRDLADDHYIDKDGLIQHVYDTHPHKGDDLTEVVGHIISPFHVGMQTKDLLSGITEEPLDLRIACLAHLLQRALEERKNRNARNPRT